MSARIKRLCVKTSDSFSERICDDLSEVLLQYLPLKDKLKLESVSKQFQRTLFVRQSELIFKKREKKGFELIRQSQKMDRIDSKTIESVVKKCPNVKSIKLFDLYDYYSNYNQTIRLIIKYCRHLTQIECNFTQMTANTFNLFVNKFGHKSQYFSVNSLNEIQFSNCFPNIQYLFVGYSVDFYEFREIKFKNLKKIQLKVEENSQSLELLIDSYPSLQYLYITLITKDSKQLNSMLALISKLKNLIELKVWTPIGLNENVLFKSLKQLATNCQNISSFGCNWSINRNNFKQMNEVLSPLRLFKRLNRLDLRLEYDSNLKLMTKQMLSFRDFIGLKDITHLNLEILNFNSLNEIFFTDIDINLPKLRYLAINKSLDATKWLANILCRLSNLETLKLDVSKQSVREFIKTKIFENCRKYKSNEISF